jgi:hypothetical protein
MPLAITGASTVTGVITKSLLRSKRRMQLMGASTHSSKMAKSHGPHSDFCCGLGDVCEEDLYIYFSSNYRACRLRTVFYGNIISIMGVRVLVKNV